MGCLKMGVSNHVARAVEAPIVLMVDGDAGLRSSAVAIIKEAELNSAEANSVEDALAYLRDHAPDVRLIFTNLELPGRLDGTDLARVALFRWPWIKVLVTSGEVRIRDVPQNVVLLPKRWDAGDIRAHLDWEEARARASQTKGWGPIPVRPALKTTRPSQA